MGVVERDKALTGAACARATCCSACPRLGLHTNGYSLARKVLFDDARPSRVDTPRARARHHASARRCSRPTGSYLAALEPLLERDKIRALAHITGGGFPGNIPRVLPEGLGRACCGAAPGTCRRCSA